MGCLNRQWPRLGHVALLLLFGGLCGAASAAEPFRVAVFNFSVGELSYRSSEAAAELTALVQSELSGQPIPGLEFVERADLERAGRELALGGVGLADRSDGLRAGHWLGADWGLFGWIQKPVLPTFERRMVLQLVDLRHGERISQTNAPLHSLATNHLAFDLTALPPLVATLRHWLAAEAIGQRQSVEALTLAWLPPKTGVPWIPWTGMPLADAPNVRWLGLNATEPGRQEVDLGAADWVRSDGKRRPFPADFMGWFLPGTQQAILWDGRGPALGVKLTRGPESGGEWRAEIAAAAESIRKERAGHSLEPEQVRALATQLMSWPGAASSDLRELALWLDPENGALREQRIRRRWERSPDTAFDPVMFNPVRHTFDDWGDFLDRVGGRSLLTTGGDSAKPVLSPAREFLDAALQGVELAGQINEKSAVGIPDDLGGAVLRGWRTRFLTGVARRMPLLLEQPDVTPRLRSLLWALTTDFDRPGGDPQVARELWPAFDAVWQRVERDQPETLFEWQEAGNRLEAFCQAAGQSAATSKYLASVATAARKRTARMALAPRTTNASALRLPRVHLLHEGPQNEFLTRAGTDFRPPELPFPKRFLGPPAGHPVKRVLGSALAADRLWLLTGSATNVPTTFLDQPGASAALWSLIPGGVLVPADPPVQPDSITALWGDGSELWMGFNGGVVRWNVRTGATNRWDKTAGMEQGPIHVIFQTKETIWALGTVLNSSGDGGRSWQSAPLTVSGSAEFRGRLPGVVTSPDSILTGSEAWLMTGIHSLYLRSWPVGDWQRLGLERGRFRAAMWGSDPVDAVALGRDDFWVLADGTVSRFHAPKQTLDPVIRWAPPTGWKRPDARMGPFSHMLGFQRANGVSNAVPDDGICELVISLSWRDEVMSAPLLTRLTRPVSAFLPEGPLLWIHVPEERSWIGVFHAESRRWLGRFPIHQNVHRFHRSTNGVWGVLSEPSSDGTVLVEIPSTPLRTLPPDQGLPEAISSAELRQRSGSRRETTAWLALLAGSPELAREQVDIVPLEDLNPEGLFLRGLLEERTTSADATTTPAAILRLMSEYPESVFSRLWVLDEARRRGLLRSAQRVTASPGAAALLIDYDVDGDGLLGMPELMVALMAEPARLGRRTGPAGSRYDAHNWMMPFDRDGQRGLSAAELTQALQPWGGPPGIRRAATKGPTP